MDDLINKFSDTTSITRCSNDINKPHPRFNKLKTGPIVNDQNKRREKFLEEQKTKHHNYINLVRNLASSLSNKDKQDGMDTEEFHTFGKNKIKDPKFADQLMIAEWMVEKPVDFEINWIMLPCPVGKRCLVISANGRTRSYGKNGHVLCHSFNSNLPGGSSRTTDGRYKRSRRNECCILDCILDQTAKIYYVLDVMAWGGQIFYDCETDFRMFWLASKFAELANDDSIASSKSHISPQDNSRLNNNFTFSLLSCYGPPLDCTTMELCLGGPLYRTPTEPSNNILTNGDLNLNGGCRLENECQGLVTNDGESRFIIDGVLFFHKASHYITPSALLGPPSKIDEDDMIDQESDNISNPLVGWLSISCLPEILGVSLPPNLQK